MMMALESSFSQNINSRSRGGTEPKKKLKKVRSVRLLRVPTLKSSTKSRLNWSSIDVACNNSNMEFSDSSLNDIKDNSRFEAKEGNSQGGIEYDDVTSIGSSSTHGSSVSMLSAPKQESRIKKSKDMKRLQKGFGSTRSFRRRARTRVMPSSIASSVDEANSQNSTSADVSDGSPNYLKATSCSKGKKVSEELNVDRATCSSTLKDSKIPQHVDLRPGLTEAERISVMKVCPYHHCSLNGHRHETPSPRKKFIYKRRRPLKPQKSVEPKSYAGSDEKRELKIREMTNKGEHSFGNRGPASGGLSPADEEDRADASSDVYTKSRAQLFRGSNHVGENTVMDEVMFSETSYPSGSFQKSLNQIEELGKLETTYKLQDSCSRCSHVESNSDVDSKEHDLTTSNDEDGKSNSRLQGENSDFSYEHLPFFINPDEELSKSCLPDAIHCRKSSADVPTTVNTRPNQDDYDEATKSRSIISSSSDSPTNNPNASNKNTKPDGQIANKLVSVGDCKPDNSFRLNTSSLEADKPLVNKQKRTSMWHLIHKQMAAGLAAEAEQKPVAGSDEVNLVDDAKTMSETKSSDSCQDSSSTDMCFENNKSGNQEIELRQLFAIKLVREAIEKILLPEVQDDDQSINSHISADDAEACAEELHIKSDSKRVDDDASSDLKECHSTTTSIHSPEKQKTVVENKNKAPKHWSNLKKWILLQRFVKELEKVRKLDKGKPRYLHAEPGHETEKIHLRSQTAEERRKAEEWMLDYALRQAVSQLAPTQKRKVSLLVKAFETMVPPQEANRHIQITVSKAKDYDEQYPYTIGKESVLELHDTNQQAAAIATSNDRETTNFPIGDGSCGDPVPEVDDSQLHNKLFLKSDYDADAYFEETPVSGNTLQEVHTDAVLSPNYTLRGGSMSNTKDEMHDNLDCGTSETSFMGQSSSDIQREPVATEKLVSSAPESISSELQNETEHVEEIIKELPEVEHLTSEEIPGCRSSGMYVPEPNSDYATDDLRDRSLAHPDTNQNTLLDGYQTIPTAKKSPLSPSVSQFQEFMDFMTAKMDALTSTVTENFEKFDKRLSIMENKVDAIKVHGSASDFEVFEQQAAVGEEKVSKYVSQTNVIQSSPENDYRDDEAYKSKLDRQNRIRMWHMIYHHVVSDIAAKVGEGLFAGADEETEDDTSSVETDVYTTPQELSRNYDNVVKENHDANCQRDGLSRSDAVKLVQEAVDQILSPEVQDESSDTRSVLTEIITDEELPEKIEDEAGEESEPNSAHLIKDHTSEPNGDEFGRSLDQEVSAIKIETPMPKNWRKLKNLILLRTSIRALQKNRKSNTEHKHPSSEPNSEREEVGLRHQVTDERKKAEQWMLDYAVQHIVTKLTPARKRRVAMLVEAFEAVVPFPEI